MRTVLGMGVRAGMVRRVAVLLSPALLAGGLYAAASVAEMSLSRSDAQSVSEERAVPAFDVPQESGGVVEIQSMDADTTAAETLNGAEAASSGSTVDTRIEVPTDLAVWNRENGYFHKTTGVRQGFPPAALGNHVPSPEDTSADGRRILVIGDSFVRGFGLEDLDRVWHRQLATMLSHRYYDGAYHFTATGAFGNSILSYSEFLTPEVIENYRPEAIIIGFLPNDWEPDGTERRLCGHRATQKRENQSCIIGDWYTQPAYIKCIEGREGFLGALLRNIVKPRFPHLYDAAIDRVCDPARFVTAGNSVSVSHADELDPEHSPYWPMYLDSLRTIVRNAGDVPVYALPTRVANLNPVRAVYDALENAGIKVIETPHTDELLRAPADKRYWINPGDMHPGSVLSQAYAQDAFDFIVSNYPARASNGTSFSERPVSNFLPGSMRYLENGIDSVLLTYDPHSEQTLRDSSESDFQMRPSPRQSVPCAEFGRPHARVVFNPQRLTDSFDVEVTLLRPDGESMVLSTVSYDADGREVIGAGAVLVPGHAIRLHLDPSTTSFMLGSARSGCPLDSELNLPAFSLKLIVV